MKNGSVSSLVPMVTALPIAADMAPSRRTKSEIATPFFHPGLGCGTAFVETEYAEKGAAQVTVFPLPMSLVSCIVTAVASPFFP